MRTIEDLRAALPEAAKDLKVNLQNVLTEGGALSEAQRWGIAVASAIASRHGELAAAVLAEAKRHVDGAVLDDAVAAAALMGMNNVFYRFRHLVEKESYSSMPARLRMTRIAKPATSRCDFELLCLAVSAVNGCGACVASHERAVLEGGLKEDHVHDAVRVAATIHGVAVALEAQAVWAAAG